MTDTNTASTGSLTALRLPELQALAAERGVKGASKMRKADLLAALGGPSPAAAHALPVSVRTKVLPEPAGALITDTRLPSARTDSAAAAWSSRSSV